MPWAVLKCKLHFCVVGVGQCAPICGTDSERERFLCCLVVWICLHFFEAICSYALTAFHGFKCLCIPMAHGLGTGGTYIQKGFSSARRGDHANNQ